MGIIKHKYIFIIISAVLVLASWLALAFWGLRPSIDFTGGSIWEIKFEKQIPYPQEIHDVFSSVGIDNFVLQPTEDNRTMIIRFKETDEAKHQELLKNLSVRGQFIENKFASIGPTIGRELKQKSWLALFLTLAAIILYIAWAFRKVSKPVASWKYGVAAIIALIHDVSIPAGVFAFLGKWQGVEVDALFITSLLTILGFSVHDTIVVFDRIRENLKKLKSSEDFGTTVGRSIRETMSRSINTSLTVMLVLAAIVFLGGETVKFFSIALLIGVFFGTYSSIFIASPLLVIWQGLSRRRN
ncbi:MAG: protein translocase subunit SecF [bacterium]|nr:protein translocase subunit SecF [bacterium]